MERSSPTSMDQYSKFDVADGVNDCDTGTDCDAANDCDTVTVFEFANDCDTVNVEVNVTFLHSQTHPSTAMLFVPRSFQPPLLRVTTSCSLGLSFGSVGAHAQNIPETHAPVVRVALTKNGNPRPPSTAAYGPTVQRKMERLPTFQVLHYSMTRPPTAR